MAVETFGAMQVGEDRVRDADADAALHGEHKDLFVPRSSAGCVPLQTVLAADGLHLHTIMLAQVFT
jgi:hypothetical protein